MKSTLTLKNKYEYSRAHFAEGRNSKIFNGWEIQNPTNEIVVKKILNSTPEEVQWVKQEIEMLSFVKNDLRFVQLLDHTIIKEHNYLIFTKCNGGDLQTFLKKKEIENKKMTEDDARNLFIEIINLIEFIHSKQIIHRDIKLGNLLMHDGHIVLADFGFAKKLNEKDPLLLTLQGTYLTMAPEVQAMKKYDLSADIYSMGAVFLQILNGKIENFYQPNEEDFLKGLNYFLNNQSNLSYTFQHLLKRMLTYKPEDRIQLQDIKNHPFFARLPLNPFAIKQKKQEENQGLVEDYTEEQKQENLNVKKLVINKISTTDATLNSDCSTQDSAFKSQLPSVMEMSERWLLDSQQLQPIAEESFLNNNEENDNDLVDQLFDNEQKNRTDVSNHVLFEDVDMPLQALVLESSVQLPIKNIAKEYIQIINSQNENQLVNESNPNEQINITDLSNHLQIRDSLPLSIETDESQTIAQASLSSSAIERITKEEILMNDLQNKNKLISTGNRQKNITDVIKQAFISDYRPLSILIDESRITASTDISISPKSAIESIIKEQIQMDDLINENQLIDKGIDKKQKNNTGVSDQSFISDQLPSNSSTEESASKAQASISTSLKSAIKSNEQEQIQMIDLQNENQLDNQINQNAQINKTDENNLLEINDYRPLSIQTDSTDKLISSNIARDINAKEQILTQDLQNENQLVDERNDNEQKNSTGVIIQQFISDSLPLNSETEEWTTKAQKSISISSKIAMESFTKEQIQKNNLQNENQLVVEGNEQKNSTGVSNQQFINDSQPLSIQTDQTRTTAQTDISTSSKSERKHFNKNITRQNYIKSSDYDNI